MNQCLATVLAVDANIALVSVKSSETCARCAAGRGCGAGLLAGTGKARKISIPIDRRLSIQPGDVVRLALDSREVLNAAVFAYGFPLAGVVLALSFAIWLHGTPGDGKAVITALAGLIAGAICGRMAMRWRRHNNDFLPTIAERVAGARQ